MLLVALGVVVLLLALVLLRDPLAGGRQLTSVDVEEAVAEALDSQTPSPAVSAQVYQVILPSLVIVQTDNVGEENSFGVGTGVVVNRDAEVLTALHIIEGATEVELAFADGTRTAATVASVEPDSDIAVLTPAVLPNLVVPATIGNASAMRVGDEVFAVGNPLGLVGSLSAGVVSGLNREFRPSSREEPLRGLIQFDAAVNPGNSGGPLVNRQRPGRRHRHRADQPDRGRLLRWHRVRGTHRRGHWRARRACTVVDRKVYTRYDQ